MKSISNFIKKLREYFNEFSKLIIGGPLIFLLGLGLSDHFFGTRLLGLLMAIPLWAIVAASPFCLLTGVWFLEFLKRRLALFGRYPFPEYSSRSARIRGDDPDRVSIEITDDVHGFEFSDLRYLLPGTSSINLGLLVQTHRLARKGVKFDY